MIRDITFGQYYNVKSPIHNLDPRTKLNATIIYLISIFFCDSYLSYFLAFLFLILSIKLSNVPFRFVFKGIKSLMLLLFLSVFFNLFLTEGKILVSFYNVNITYEGLNLAIKMAFRLCFLILFSSLLSLTTTPKKLTDGMEEQFKFLNIIKVPVADIALMMSISLRFVPILVEEVDKIMKAQTSRGARLDDKNIVKRVKSYVPLLVPIFVSAFRRANDLSLAMEARCYNDSDNRTKLNPLKYGINDMICYIILIFYVIIIIVIKNIVKG